MRSRAKPEPTTNAPAKSRLQSDDLIARPLRPRDYRGERDALLAIGRHMVDTPRRALQAIVEAAHAICEAGSAGISLLSASDCYWMAMAGEWRGHIGRRMPYGFAVSDVLDHNVAQLFAHPERHFLYLRGLTPPVKEALVVPFFVSGSATGALWVVSHHDAPKFDAEDARLLENIGQLTGAIYPLGAAVEIQEQESKSLRDVNEQLVLSSVRQRELTEQAQQAEALVRESGEQLRGELAATQRLQETSTRLIGEDSGQKLYEQILDAALAIMRSECASIHALDVEDGSDRLHLLGYRGFDPEVAQIWERVPASTSPWGVALQTGERIFVRNVEQCEFMPDGNDLAMYLQAGIRALQVTPLTSRAGRLLGVLSTYWKTLHEPPEFDLHLLDVLARQAADFIERSQVQVALQESDRHFRALAEAIPVIVWTADATGWIDWYNNRWYEYTGQTPEEAAGWGWQAAHHPEDFQRVMEAWPSAIATGEPLEIEFRLRRNDGVFRHFLTRIRPFRNDRGKVVRWYGSNFDIQAQKTALEQSQRVAETLQGRFLPIALPHSDKVRFDASYTAAEENVLVGGDWFEATNLPDGRYLISVGDVTGHGLDASVIADRLRQAVTDFAFTADDPAAILASANRVLRFQSPDIYATAVVALIDRNCTTLTYATAGHPPPLLATSQAAPAQALPYGGLPLGFSDDLGLVSRAVDILPGSVLAFYTDGLTEFARDIDTAEFALKAAVARIAGNTSLAAPATAIKSEVLGEARATDDIALLIVQFAEINEAAVQSDPAVLTKTWRFHSSDAHTAHTSRRELVEFMRPLASDPNDLFTAEVILGEILANSVKHAPGLVEVQIDWTGENPIVTVLDAGPGLRHRFFELPQDVMAERGRGMFLIDALSKAGSLSLSKGGTELRTVLPLTRRHRK